ncbi:MAG: hypothetical protein JW818_15215 [Pirellulales bacterium]|nr:hypothetical protein [Pirellulales bacterium]
MKKALLFSSLSAGLTLVLLIVLFARQSALAQDKAPPEGPKWEYKVHTLISAERDAKGTEAVLNRVFGAGGWELCGTTIRSEKSSNDSTTTMFVFKRIKR